MAEAHAFEPELLQPVPRPVRDRAGGCRLWFIRLFLLPLTLIGIYLLLGPVVGTLSYLCVAKFGVEMEGRLSRKEESRSRSGRRIIYVLHYVYTVEGRDYTGDDTVSEEQGSAWKEGQAVPVRVLPWAPREHWLLVPEVVSPEELLIKAWLIALVFNAATPHAWWKVWIRPRRQRQLVRGGELTTGIVRDVRSKAMKDGVLFYTIRYEYTCPPAVYTRSASSMEARVAEVKVGDVLTVLYDPKRPKRSVPYLFAEFEVKTT